MTEPNNVIIEIIKVINKGFFLKFYYLDSATGAE